MNLKEIIKQVLEEIKKQLFDRIKLSKKKLIIALVVLFTLLLIYSFIEFNFDIVFQKLYDSKKEKPKIEFIVFRTYVTEPIRNSSAKGNVHVTLMANSPSINKERFVMINFPIRKEVGNDTVYRHSFDYVYYKEKCPSCTQYIYMIHNPSKVDAKNVLIYTFSDFIVKDILQDDQRIEFKRGSGLYEDKGFRINVPILKKGETILFSFSSKYLSDVHYNCYIEDNSKLCSTALIDTKVFTLGDEVTSFYFTLQNITTALPILNEENPCYTFNLDTKEWTSGDCKIMDTTRFKT
ncbi:hypothetical protein HYX07_00910 [Candidatus Woesearchaeota archaeon]|nr:hypothetical protein [Candidatus Woesearchaeota archaeon]